MQLTFSERSPKLFSVKVGFGGNPCVKILEIRLNMADKKTSSESLFCIARKSRAKRYAEKSRLIVIYLRRIMKNGEKLRSFTEFGLGNVFI